MAGRACKAGANTVSLRCRSNKQGNVERAADARFGEEDWVAGMHLGVIKV